jgi:hypothetical protein
MVEKNLPPVTAVVDTCTFCLSDGLAVPAVMSCRIDLELLPSANVLLETPLLDQGRITCCIDHIDSLEKILGMALSRAFKSVRSGIGDPADL